MIWIIKRSQFASLVNRQPHRIGGASFWAGHFDLQLQIQRFKLNCLLNRIDIFVDWRVRKTEQFPNNLRLALQLQLIPANAAAANFLQLMLITLLEATVMNRLLKIGFSSATKLLKGVTVTYRLLFRVFGQNAQHRVLAR